LQRLDAGAAGAVMTRVGAALAVLFTAFTANLPASAQDWHTLTNETTDVTFAMVEQRSGGARIWLRFVLTDGAERDERRALVDVTCSPPSAVTVDGAPLVERVVPLVASAACNLQAPTSAPRRLDSSQTATHVNALLRSENPSDQDRGIEIMLSEPGGFAPMVFVSLANTLLERGRRDEAIQWFMFGYVRLTTDMRAAILANPAYGEAMAIVYPAYGFSASYELDGVRGELSEDEINALARRAIVSDSEIPRFYPLDMPLAPVGVRDVAWGSPDAPRPGSDFLIRAQLDAARRELNEGLQ
jgi:hypothetical protein